MPLNAGAIDATPTRRTISFSYIDLNGQVRTDSYDIPNDATDAELNTLATELGALTNASLWDITISSHFATAQPSKSDAVVGADDSIKDNVVILFKTLANQAFDLFIPAPDETNTLVIGTVNPDPTPMAALVAAAEAVWGGYSVVSYRYSERRKKNRAVKA